MVERKKVSVLGLMSRSSDTQVSCSHESVLKALSQIRLRLAHKIK